MFGAFFHAPKKSSDVFISYFSTLILHFTSNSKNVRIFVILHGQKGYFSFKSRNHFGQLVIPVFRRYNFDYQGNSRRFLREKENQERLDNQEETNMYRSEHILRGLGNQYYRATYKSMGFTTET